MRETPRLWTPGCDLPAGARAEEWLRRERRRRSHIRDPRVERTRQYECAFGKAQTGVLTEAFSGTAVVLVLGSNPSAGSLVVIGAQWFDGGGTAPVMTVQDSNGNNYTVEAHNSGTTNISSAGWCGQAYLNNAPANASKTITITFDRTIVAACGFADNFSVSGGTSAYNDGAFGSGTGDVVTPTIPVAGAGTLVTMFACDSAVVTGVSGSWVANDAGVAPTLGSLAAYILSVSSNTACGMTATAAQAYNAVGQSFTFTPSAGRTTKNTRSAPLGTEIGMGWRMAA